MRILVVLLLCGLASAQTKIEGSTQIKGTIPAANVGGVSANTAATTAPSPMASSECESQTAPFLFQLDGGGTPTWHTAAGLNTSLNFSGYNTAATRSFIEFCRPVIFNMGGIVPTSVGAGTAMGANGAALFFLHPTPTTTTLAMQTQVTILTGDTNAYSGQVLGHYSEVQLWGTGALTGSSTPGQVGSGGLRGVSAWNTTTGTGTNGLLTGVSGTTFREANAVANCGNVLCYIGGYFTAFNYSTVSNNGAKFAGVLGQVNDGTLGEATGFGYAVYAQKPAPSNYFSRTDQPANVGLYADDFGTGLGSWDLFVASAAANSGAAGFAGPVVLSGAHGIVRTARNGAGAPGNKDAAGRCTMSSGTCTTYTFTETYGTKPYCQITWTGVGTLTGLLKSNTTTTTLTPASTVNTDTAEIDWWCVGSN